MSVQSVYTRMVPATEFRFSSKDGLRIFASRWDALGPVRGVIQIAHGMGEHIERYTDTIEALVSAGFTVYGNDHRGHGRTALSAHQIGDFGDGGFDLLVDDMMRLSRIATDENPGKPFILFGHSMGSFAAQQYVLTRSGKIDGLILSGSGALDGLARLASSVSASENFLNAAFEPARTPFDWLSRDTAVVDAFINDPLCFAQLTPESQESFLAAAFRLANPNNIRRIREDLPVYLFSGTEDPVGQQTEGVEVQMQRYRKAGLYDVSHDFYHGGRHEMLNEINRDEVRKHLLAWIFAALERRKGWPKARSIA